MRQSEQNGYSSKFLSPTKSPTKKRLNIFGRRDSPSVSPSPEKQVEKRASIIFRMTTTTNQHNESSLIDEDDDDVACTADITKLLSPRLERQLMKSDRRIPYVLSPLGSIRSSIRQLSLHSSTRTNSNDEEEEDDDASESESEASDEEVNSDEEVEKVATEDDLLLLICRELELITGDSDEDYDDADEDH